MRRVISEVADEPCVAPQALCAAMGGYVSFYASNLSENYNLSMCLLDRYILDS